VPSHGHSLLIPVFLLKLSNGSRPQHARARALQDRARETRVSGAQIYYLTNDTFDTFESAGNGRDPCARLRFEEARSRVKRRPRLSSARGTGKKQQKEEQTGRRKPHPVWRVKSARFVLARVPDMFTEIASSRSRMAPNERPKSSEPREWRRNGRAAMVFTWGQQGPSAGPTGAY